MRNFPSLPTKPQAPGTNDPRSTGAPRGAHSVLNDRRSTR